MSFTSFCLSFALSIWNLFCLSLFVVALVLIASRSYAACRPFNPHVHCVDDPIYPVHYQHHRHPHDGHGRNIHFRSDNSYFHGRDNVVLVSPPNNGNPNFHGRNNGTTPGYPNTHYRG